MYINFNITAKAITETKTYTLHNKQLWSEATEPNMANYNHVLNLNSIIVPRD